MKASTTRVLRQKSAWETLSVEEALNCLERMPLLPSVEDFTSILHRCTKTKNLDYTKRLHAYMCESGLEDHKSLGNYLIPMLVQVESMHDAQQVFNRLVHRNVYSWTSLIIGYIECGESQYALDLYREMQEDCVHPNNYTFVSLLKACARLKDVERGQEIHAEIARKGFERDLFVGSTLVDMYAKSRHLVKAREALDKLPVRSEVSWTALIAGYAEHGLGEEALNCFDDMQLEGVSPNTLTFVCSLKSCASIGAIDKGQEIHAEVVKKGFDQHLVVGSTLVDMYAKCGSLPKAQEVFDKLPIHDVVSWNILILGYAENGLSEKALACFKEMQLEGVSPDAVTFVCTLKACGILGAILKGQEIHAEIARMGSENDVSIGNTLVDMYAKCGLLAKAQEAFHKLPLRNEVSWTALIAGYAEYGLGEEAVDCIKEMHVDRVSPDAVAFVCSLKVCSSIGAIHKGREIHAEIFRKALERELIIGASLVDMYAKCGSLAKAQEVFVRLPVRNVVSWTALIAGYAEHALGEDALDCFEQMQLEGISPNALTFVCILKACGRIGAIDKGREIHIEIARKGLETDHYVGSTLVDMYAKCSSLSEAREAFDKVPVPNVALWNALITGFAQLGECGIVFRLLERMRAEGIKPVGVTFIIVLTLCSHAGLVDKGQKYFEAMCKDYGITPTLEHHACMVDLLGRAGQLDEAVSIVKKMPFHPNLVVWRTLLGACRNWQNAELGKKAFENALQLDEADAAAYVLMSNIYANSGMQKDRKVVNECQRTSMQEARIELD